MGRPSFTIDSINIEGVDHQTHAVIDQELHSLLDTFANFDLDLIHDVRLKVIVTDQMESTVDRTNLKYGHPISAPYQQQRHAVKAAGILISSSHRPPIDATVVLDVDPWTRQTGEDIVQRVHLVGHEVGHVLQQGRGTGVRWTAIQESARNHASEIRRTAAILRDEFDADITANTVCDLFLRDDRGNKIQPASIFGQQFIDATRELFISLCRFAAKDVQMYRCFHVGFDDLYPTASSLIGELLLLITHTTALYVGAEGVDHIVDQLRHTPGYMEYYEPDRLNYQRALINEDSTAGEMEIVRIIQSVFDRVGLRAEDMPDGSIYLHVHEPVISPGFNES